MRSSIINISLPKPLLDDIDKLMAREARTRSEFFRQAARSYLMKRRKLDALYAYGRSQAKLLGVKTSADVEKLIAEVRAER